MYNIPVALWILDTHPIHAPLCYVRPTPDMQIKVSQHVDGNGKIYLPYLHEWDAANSDILGLVQMCIITFGEQPPVFARPQNQGHAPQQVETVQDFLLRVGIETTYVSCGKNHISTKSYHRQNYQNYGQPCQRTQNSDFQSNFLC